MKKLHTDLILEISSFLQRTDQIALKMTNKYYYMVITPSSLNDELLLYTKTIDQLQYSWSGNDKYINIIDVEDDELEQSLIINKRIAVTNNLWFFSFNTEFHIYPDKYVIFFMTSLQKYTMTLVFINKNNIKNTTKHDINDKNNNGIVINFKEKGTLKITCEEIKTIKNYETVHYMTCMPIYYWNHIGYYNKWKRKIRKRTVSGSILDIQFV